jgi:hypothetical protein
MHSIQQTLRNASVNGVINIDKAIKALEAFDQEREATRLLLIDLEKQVGMTDGEKINAHLATMTGKYFNPVDYHYEAMPAEQRI